MIQFLSLLLLINMVGVVQASQTTKIKTYKNILDFAQSVRLEDTVATIANLASTIPTSNTNLDYSKFQTTIDCYYKNPLIVKNDKLFTQACYNKFANERLMQKVAQLPFSKVEETFNNLLKIRTAFAVIRPPKGCNNAVNCGISLLQPYVQAHGSYIDGIKRDDLHSTLKSIVKKVCCYPIAKKLS